MTPRDFRLMLLALVVSSVLFGVDATTPQGVAVGVLYAVPVLISLWASRPWHVWAAAFHGSLFTILAAFLKADFHLAPAWMNAMNRGFALLAIWAAALIVDLNHSARRKLEASRAEADQRGNELALSRKRLEDIRYAIDQAAIVAITDRAGRIEYANDKFCEVSEYSREELLGSDHRLLNSGYHPRAFFLEMWRNISAGQVWRGEVRNRKKGGALYWVDTTIVPLLGPDGQPEQYLSIRTDITERKLAEERLRKQEALARLGEMAAIVAHEVKNPLTGIAGALQIIGGRMPPESPDRRIVRDMIDRIWALHRSLQDLLVFARPRLPELRPTPLAPLVRDSVDLLAKDVRFSGLHLEVDAPAVEADVDPDLFREAVLNVLVNAAQATEGKGSVRVRVGTGVEGAWVQVADDGPGIPADLREKVFEPFFTTRARGTGLGLPIVRRTLELLGGTVAIACPPDGGTTVTLRVPPQVAAVLPKITSVS